MASIVKIECDKATNASEILTRSDPTLVPSELLSASGLAAGLRSPAGSPQKRAPQPMTKRASYPKIAMFRRRNYTRVLSGGEHWRLGISTAWGGILGKRAGGGACGGSGTISKIRTSSTFV